MKEINRPLLNNQVIIDLETYNELINTLRDFTDNLISVVPTYGGSELEYVVNEKIFNRLVESSITPEMKEKYNITFTGYSNWNTCVGKVKQQESTEDAF